MILLIFIQIINAVVIKTFAPIYNLNHKVNLSLIAPGSRLRVGYVNVNCTEIDYILPSFIDSLDLYDRVLVFGGFQGGSTGMKRDGMVEAAGCFRDIKKLVAVYRGFINASGVEEIEFSYSEGNGIF